MYRTIIRSIYIAMFTTKLSIIQFPNIIAYFNNDMTVSDNMNLIIYCLTKRVTIFLYRDCPL